MDVNIADHSAVISFNDYYDGASPALVVNHTPWLSIGYKQRLAPPTTRYISCLTRDTRPLGTQIAL